MKKLAPLRRATILTTALLALSTFGALSASAQGAKPAAPKAEEQKPEPFKNLKVFPKDIAHDDLIGAMRGWSRALSVRCDYCHVESEKTHEEDFPADGKPEKETARQMLKMVLAINKDYISTLPAHGEEHEHAQQVGCYTCHRGAAEPPRDLATMLTGIAKEKGVAAALARYQEIKKDHPNDGKYDFSERSLLIVGSNLAEAEKLDDALVVLKADLEIYPSSSNVHGFVGRLLAQKGDLSGAEVNLKKAIELDPKNEGAKRALARLYETKDKPKPQ